MGVEVLTWILIFACMTLGTITAGDGIVASKVPTIPLILMEASLPILDQVMHVLLSLSFSPLSLPPVYKRLKIFTWHTVGL